MMHHVVQEFIRRRDGVSVVVAVVVIVVVLVVERMRVGREGVLEGSWQCRGSRLVKDLGRQWWLWLLLQLLLQ